MEAIESRFTKILEKYINIDKMNHAYLIETNNSDRLKIAKELVAFLFKFKDINEIDNLERNFDLQIVKTNTLTIKKEEILALKENFKTKSIYNSKRVYIIEEAEKLNNSSANTLLKFLEEPENDIIAILVTSNRNLVINTIVSRCQIIRYYSGDISILKTDVIDKTLLFDFALTVEKEKEKTIAYINKFYTKEILERSIFSEFLKSLLYLYDDVLHYKVGVNLEYFNLYSVEIEKIANYNDIDTIKNKMNAINICLDRIKYNTNIKLLLDKLIILMSGVDVDAWSSWSDFFKF